MTRFDQAMQFLWWSAYISGVASGIAISLGSFLICAYIDSRKKREKDE